MDKQILLDQIEFAKQQIAFMQDEIFNSQPQDKGYLQKIDSYNRWIDRYNLFIEKLEKLDESEVKEQDLKKKERLDNIYRWSELGVKIAIPVLSTLLLVGLGELAYKHDGDMDLCNGRIWGLIGQGLKVIH